MRVVGIREGSKKVKLLWSREMWGRIFTIAKKEIKQNIRSRWIIFLTAAFFLLSVLVSYYGTSFEESTKWLGLENTILYMTTYVEYMVPLLGLMLGYGSIVREKEDNSIELLLSYPVDRGEVLSGKFLGLWTLLSGAVIVGLGVGGVIIGFKVENVVWSEYYLFILSSILLGGVYLSISMMFSVLFDNSTTTMASSVFLFFLFSFLWLFTVYAVAQLTFGWDVVRAGSPPKWYFGLQLFNPVLIWYSLLALNIPALRQWAMEFGGEEPQYQPHFYDTWIMIILLLIWIAVPLILSERWFNRREIK